MFYTIILVVSVLILILAVVVKFTAPKTEAEKQKQEDAIQKFKESVGEAKQKISETQQTQPAQKVTFGSVVFAVIIGGLVFYGTSSLFSSPDSEPSQVSETVATTETVAKTPPPKVDMLELVSQSCSVEYNYTIVSGQVKNISDVPLNNVEVVAVSLAEDGTQITSDSALIEYNPILPGQTSPFKSYMKYNPAMAKCGVMDFKELMGGTIQTKRN